MSQVLRVCKSTGFYDFLDIDGKIIGKEMSMCPMETTDADVLMERIRQGYVTVPIGYYVVRQEFTKGNSPEEFLEITEMVTFGMDDDGYTKPSVHCVLTTKQWTNAEEYAQPSTRLAVVDYENKSIQWLLNPLVDEWFVYDPCKAAQIPWVDLTLNHILSQACFYLTKGKPEWVMGLPVHFN